jgi:Putative addiction module component
MTALLNALEQQARQLASAERVELAEMLLASVQEPTVAAIEAAWAREIADRMAAWKRGETEIYDAEDVLAEVRALCQ